MVTKVGVVLRRSGSDVRGQLSEVWDNMSGVSCQMSGVRYQGSVVRGLGSDVRGQLSEVWGNMSGVRFEAVYSNTDRDCINQTKHLHSF